LDELDDADDHEDDGDDPQDGCHAAARTPPGVAAYERTGVWACAPLPSRRSKRDGHPAIEARFERFSRDDRAVAEQRLPSGVVTFVLSDIVGSTRLWETAPARMESALARHDEIVAAAVAANDGVVLKARGEGDSTFSVFTLATDAVAAAYAAQVGLAAAGWPTGARLAVRFAVHTGEAVERDGDFLGPAVNRAARLRAVAEGSEVLVSGSTARLVVDRLPARVRLVELGEVRLRDLDRPEPAYVLTGPGLPEPRTGPIPRGAPAERPWTERRVTLKESEVLDALCEHLTNAQIASRLYVSERTVESHISSLLRKFQVANRHELARAAASPGGVRSSGEPTPAALERERFPTAVTPLVGRESELSRISALLAEHSLVTLVGAGGTGKTRLATHFAATPMTTGFHDSWCAEFAAVYPSGNTAEVLMGALGVRPTTQVDPMERVVLHLAQRTGLLVLDNCEHVRAQAAAMCERIIRAAPSIRILATSRQPLGVDGEVLFSVPALTTPSDNTSDVIAAADAVKLFVERARSYKPDFSLNDNNSVAIAELCRALDGLPLAIELAAARIPTMTPEEIVSRLDRLFQVLGHRPDHIDHHRTLRATLDWSYDLLETDEQGLLAELAIFAPGFSLAAVEALTTGASQDRYGLDVLSALVAKSMVVAEVKYGMTRLRLLETVRAYALEKGADQPERQDDAWRRHLAFYTGLADELAGPAVIADVDTRTEQLEAEAPNIRLALDYAVDTNDVSSVFRLTGALVDVWCLWGWGASVLSALEAVLHRDSSGETGRADAFANAAWSAWSQGRHSEAISWCDESERCSTSDRDPLAPRVHVIRGMSRLLDSGDVVGGVALCERGLQELSENGHLRRYAHDLAAFGSYLAVVGETARAAKISTESVALARQLRDRRTLSIALAALGYSSICSDPQQARNNFGEVIGIGDRWCTGSAWWGLGWIGDLAEDRGGAARCYREALELWSDTGDRRGVFYAVQGIAIVSTRVGDFATAARLFAGADAMAGDVGAGSMPQWNTWRDQHLDTLRDALSPVDLSTSWAAGERLAVDVLVKEAGIAARRTETDAANA
jgi:predicted ATPase/class 3 adenylate cyclase/DNA-binding CsgD family transcriptional regulator